MSQLSLIFKSLRFYWRSHLAVLLGVIVGTAVIGGALIVGDSVRESLRQLTLKRLGRVDFSLGGERFFRQKLVDEIAADPRFEKSFDVIAPAISVRAGLVHEVKSQRHRANQVGFWGIDERLWQLVGTDATAVPQDRDIILSAETAAALQAKVGDEISVWVELPSAIPRDSLLGDRNQTSREFVFTVSAVLDGSTTADRFQMAPTQQLTRNAFVSLETLQEILDLAEIRETPRTPVGKPARINACFVSARGDDFAAMSPTSATTLNRILATHVDLADFYLRLREVTTPNPYLTLESEQMILDTASADAGRTAAEKSGLTSSTVLVYLANELKNPADETKFSMYSVLAGVDRTTLDQAPFGPMTMVAGDWPDEMADDEIVLNQWVATDLGVQPGDEIRILWHTVGSHGELPEEEHRFRVRGIVAFEGTPADDRGWTPELEGITDVDSFDDWKQPFKMNLDIITDRDDDYWAQHRATPKGFLSLRTAQKLWSSRYGNLTSIRFSLPPASNLQQPRESLANTIESSMDLRRSGMEFQPIKLQGLLSAQGTTDFSGLFIGFSFFLILAAAILIGLFFRLGIEQRVSSIGLLNSIGLQRGTVWRLLIAESLLVLFAGAAIGTLAAIGYARLMVYGLATWWVGAIGTSELVVQITPVSLSIGAAISIVVAAVSLWWSLRSLKGRSCRSLLSGVLDEDSAGGLPAPRRTRVIVGTATLCGAALLAASGLGLVPDSEAFSGISWKVCTFFVVGLLALTASLSGLSIWVSSDTKSAVHGSGFGAVGRLAIRNSARNRARTVLTVGLISFASFVIVAVAAGHRDPASERPDFHSGNGGFSLIAESSSPILFDPNSNPGRESLNLVPDPQSAVESILARTEVMPFRIKHGQDASCLNLYQAQLPTLLGATPRMIARGGFKFSGASEENPWTRLNQALPEKEGLPVYPAMGDMNTLQYSLHIGMGAYLPVPNAEEPTAWIQIVGVYDSSIFQGTLVLSEADFLKLNPQQQGYGWFLIGAADPASEPLSDAAAAELAVFLESRLDQYGFDVDRVADRLAAFLKVQNTYLTTFQTLGGLGLLLGTIGLGTVMLRNVIERRSELALLQAIGLRRGSIALLVLWENTFLLIWGLLTGTAAALLAMIPHLLSTGADVPWQQGGWLLAGVLLAGLLASILPLRQALRTPVLAALRNE